MKYFVSIVALIAFASVVGFSTVSDGGQPKHRKAEPQPKHRKAEQPKHRSPRNVKKAEPQAGQLPLAQVQSGFKHYKVEKKGLVIGEVIQSSIGLVLIYDNGKGYRWAEQTETPFIYTYNNGGTQKIYMERQDGNPVNVTTKRYGIVFADPRLLNDWD